MNKQTKIFNKFHCCPLTVEMLRQTQEGLHVLFENLVQGDEKHLEQGVYLGGQT